jgi:hypothetical protein
MISELRWVQAAHEFFGTQWGSGVELSYEKVKGKIVSIDAPICGLTCMLQPKGL